MAEGVIVVFNIFCVIAGLGAYLWFSCTNRCLKLKRFLKIAFYSLFCCKKCCENSAAGIWFTRTEANWKDNPMEKKQEMKPMGGDVAGPELVAKLQADIKSLQTENKEQQKEIKSLQTENESLREKIARLEGDVELGVPKDVWEQVTGADGSIYFHNRETNETTWEVPEESWEELKDDEGNVYYYNRDTGETSWDQPMITNPMRK